MAPACFLDLPGELRNQIYNQYFEDIRHEHFDVPREKNPYLFGHSECQGTRFFKPGPEWNIECDTKVWAKYARIFYTSQQVYAESRPLFFEHCFPKHRFECENEQLGRLWEYFGRPKKFMCNYFERAPHRPHRDIQTLASKKLEIIAAAEGFSSLKEMEDKLVEIDEEFKWPSSKKHICKGSQSDITLQLTFRHTYHPDPDEQPQHPNGFFLTGDIGAFPLLEQLLALDTEENLAQDKLSEEEERWAFRQRQIAIKARVEVGDMDITPEYEEFHECFPDGDMDDVEEWSEEEDDDLTNEEDSPEEEYTSGEDSMEEEESMPEEKDLPEERTLSNVGDGEDGQDMSSRKKEPEEEHGGVAQGLVDNIGGQE